MRFQINIVKSTAEKLDDKNISLELERIINQLEEMNIINETVSNFIYKFFSAIIIYYTYIIIIISQFTYIIYIIIFNLFDIFFQTLDSLLCMEVKMVEKLDSNYNNYNREGIVGASYHQSNPSSRPYKKREFRRPGISDLL